MRVFAQGALVAALLAAPALAYDPRLPVLGDEPGAEQKVARFRAAVADQPEMLAALDQAQQAGIPLRDRIHQALLTQPEYAAAYASYELSGDNAQAWRVLLSRLPKEARFQRAHATYLLGRALLNRDELEGAAAALEAVRGRLRLETPWTDEATFYLAFIYARLPSRTGTAEAANESRARRLLQAIAPLEGKTVASYPETPERVREAAAWLLRELRGEGSGPLIELARRMDAIRRMIHKTETGDPTQEKQHAVVAELDRLIELMRQKEQGGGGGGGGGQQGGQQQGPGQGGNPNGNQQSGGPAQSSQLPGGQSRVGDLAEGRNAATSDEWGNLRDKEREEAIQFLREKFPTRYREIIERYYRALAEEDN